MKAYSPNMTVSDIKLNAILKLLIIAVPTRITLTESINHLAISMMHH